MKKKTINKLMNSFEKERLADSLYLLNALLLILKESKGKLGHNGIISEQFREAGERFAEKYEGLELFTEKVNHFNKEAYFQLCNSIQNLKGDDIQETVFSIYDYLKDTSLYMGHPFNEGLINNAEFYNFIQATIDFSIISSVYDPAFGIGMGFVSILKKVGENSLTFAGQEIDPILWANMKNILAIFDIPSEHIYRGDTLSSPSNVSEETIQQYDLVLVDPPQGLKIDSDVFARDEFMRFKYGYTTKSDLAFLEHALASKKDTGLLIGLINLNSLKTKGREKAIRKNILLDNNLTTVIQLEKTRGGLSSFTPCILMFGENQKSEKVNMMAYTGQKNRRSQGLSEYYQTDEEKRENSLWVLMEDIKSNDYSLTPSFYIHKERLKQANPMFLELDLREKISINDIAEISSGISGGIKGLSEKKTKQKPNKVYFLKSSDIDAHGQVVLDNAKAYWYGEEDKGVWRTLLAKNDLVFVTRGDTGKVGIVREIPEEAQIGAGMNMIKIHVKEGEYSPFFLFELIRSEYGKHMIETAILESGILKKITLKELAEFRVPVLEKSEWEAFDERYLKVLQEEEKLRQQIEGLKEEKKDIFTKILKN